MAIADELVLKIEIQNETSTEFSQLKKDISDLSKSVDESSQSFESVDTQIKTTTTSVNDASTKYNQLSPSINSATIAIQSSGTTINETNQLIVTSIEQQLTGWENVTSTMQIYSPAVEEAAQATGVLTETLDSNAEAVAGVENELIGNSLVPAEREYSEAVTEAAQRTGEFTGMLDESQGSIQQTEFSLQNLDTSLQGLGDAMGTLEDIFDLQGLGIFAENIESLPGSIMEASDAVNGLGDNFSSLFDGIGDIGSGDILGGIQGLIGGIGGIGSAITAVMAVWDIGKELLGGIGDFFGGLFKDTKSQGTEAAEAFQNFVATNIEGGAEMEAALKQSFGEMSAASFDYAQFIEATGLSTYETFGGISEQWQQGATSMDQFVIAVGNATGNMEKAPQVALQMMAGFQDMGLSAQEAGQKMLEIAQASGMSTAEVERLQASLSGVQGQLAGTGEEGGITTESLDGATEATIRLRSEVEELDSGLGGVSAQLTGTTTQGGSTTAMLDGANVSAAQLGTRVNDLSSDMIGLTSQLTGTGTQVSTTTGLFGVAGISAQGLQTDINSLQQMTGLAGSELQSLQHMLNTLPPQKQIELLFQIRTTGEIPSYHNGGVINVPQYHNGGMIAWERVARAHTGRLAPDEVPIIAQTGEAVLNRKAVRKLGEHGVNALNRGQQSSGSSQRNGNNYTVNVYASVITDQTVREIDQKLNRLTKRRSIA